MRISDWSSDVCSSDLFFPVAPDADRRSDAGHADLARKAVRLDAAQFGKRDGIFPPADEPRRRTGQPGRDLGEAAESPVRTQLAFEHCPRPCDARRTGAKATGL